jgi:Cu(I)/Ag(I) efflux system membrane fusion protein
VSQNTLHDDNGDSTAKDTPRSNNASSSDVSPDAVRGWQPRDSRYRRDPRWYMRHRTTLLIGAGLFVLVLVAITFRATTSTQRATTDGSAGGKASAGMAGMQTSSDGAVALTSTQIRQFGVTFGTAEQRTLTNAVRTAGIVTADETRLTSVTPRFGGFVERLLVNSMGQPVRKGQPLATVYSPDVLAAEQELLLARGLDRTLSTSRVPGVAGAPADLVTAARRRLELWDVSSAQIDAVLRTGKPSPTVTLYSPATGVVTDLKVMQGQAIQAGMPLYTITDLSQVWVDADIREADAALVRVGTNATLTFAAYPGKQYAARVGYIYPTVQDQARTIRARIVVSNGSGALMPGMYVTVNLTAPTRSALTVPSSAVVQTGDRSLVFVDAGGVKLIPHDVTIGRVAGDYTEILSGVEAGQRVVTSAQFLIDSESNLGEVMKSMISTGSGAATGTSGNSPSDKNAMQSYPGAASAPGSTPR